MNLLIDIATNRVIKFSDNISELSTSFNTTIAYYSGEMPETMTVSNCWNWQLIGKELVNLSQNNTAFNVNKKTLLAKINSKCMTEHATIQPTLIVYYTSQHNTDAFTDLIRIRSKATGDSYESTMCIVQQEIHDALKKQRIIEFIKTRFITAVERCNGISELDSVRSRFERSMFTQEYVDDVQNELITVLSRNIDVSDMLNEVLSKYHNFDLHQQRQQKIKVQENTRTIPLVRGMPLSGKSWPENLWDSHMYTKTDLYAEYPIITSWLENYCKDNGLILARIAIVELNDEGSVGSHIDVGEYYKKRNRYHLCLQGSYEYNVLNKTELITRGMLIQFDNKNIHSAKNVGDCKRISIIFDAEQTQAS